MRMKLSYVRLGGLGNARGAVAPTSRLFSSDFGRHAERAGIRHIGQAIVEPFGRWFSTWNRRMWPKNASAIVFASRDEKCGFKKVC